MLTRRPAVAVLAAGLLAVTLASCSADEPEPEESPSGSVVVDVDQAPEDSPGGVDEAASGGEDNEGSAGAGGQGEAGGEDESADSAGQDGAGEQPDQEILIGTGEEESDFPTDPPAGLSEDEWRQTWRDAQEVARTYLVERYSVSHTDPDPDQWRIDASALSTPAWQDELGELTSMAGSWDEITDSELSYLVQVLGPATLDHSRTFSDQEMTIFLSYRTWENSRYTGTQMPAGWDLYENDLGAPGGKFTAVEMRNIDSQWLVDSEGQVPVTGMGD